MNKNNLISTVLMVAVLLAVVYFFPWRDVNWGMVQVSPSETITVRGYGESRESNQVASFSAGVDAQDEDRDVAVGEVNRGIEALIARVKAFGIPEEDIRTQSISIYRSEDPYYFDGVSQARTFQWRASNSIEVIVRDPARFTGFGNMLAQSEATSVWGPNLSIGESRRDAETNLLADAIEDARKKAEKVAESSGRRLGKMISVVEGGADVYYPMTYRSFEGGMGGGGDMAIEPGTSPVSQSVVVVFELR